MKTSSFQTYFGPGRISIARSAPRGMAAGYKVFKDLAPGPWFNSVPQEVYRERYFAQLALLNPQKVADRLVELGQGAEPVLLCYEKPPFTASNWCHRRMVAEWFLNELGLVVDEVEGRVNAVDPRQVALL